MQTGLPDQAVAAAQRAQNLETQGLQAGAFQSASQAAVLADATVATADAAAGAADPGPRRLLLAGVVERRPSRVRCTPSSTS